MNEIKSDIYMLEHKDTSSKTAVQCSLLGTGKIKISAQMIRGNVISLTSIRTVLEDFDEKLKLNSPIELA